MIYDVETGSFTLFIREAAATPYYEQTFRPQDRNAVASNAYATVYERDGDRLVLTKANDPDLGLRYVASAAWTTDDVLPVLGTNFTENRGITVFGFETPLQSVPNNGDATYTLKIFGTLIDSGGEAPLSGGGTLTADFDSGLVQTSMTIDKTVGGVTSLWRSTNGHALLMPSPVLHDRSSLFKGNLTIGSFAGSFYGPRAQEVGGVFSYSLSSAPAEYAIGNFVGSTSSPAPAPSTFNTSLNNLQVSDAFPVLTGYSASNASGAGGGGAISYDKATDSFVIPLPIQTGGVGVDPYQSLGFARASSGDINGVLSNPSKTVYDLPDYQGVGAPDRYTRYVGASPYALDYVAIGVWENSDFFGRAEVGHGAYGLLTPQNSGVPPMTGVATYNIQALGSYNGSGAEAITGSGAITHHFQSPVVEVDLALSHNGSPWHSFEESGPASLIAANGQASYSVPLRSVDDPTFGAGISFNYFGPAGQNIGGNFVARNPDSLGIATESAAGAFVGERAP